MKLILHIGTHKTGTTALQEFLAGNTARLAARGIHYAVPGYETVANSIAHALETGRNELVGEFFACHFQEALRKRAHTIVVSGENFYGMTPLMMKLGRGQGCTEVLSREKSLVANLRASIPREVTTEIVAYFRRPDYYLESLYNQSIKYDFRFEGDCLAFYEIIADMLSYKNIFQLWCDVFGARFCSAYSYDAVKSDLVPHFMRSVLSVDGLTGFHESGMQKNVRISRDLLEYKRQKNLAIPQSEWAIERKIFFRLNKNLKFDSSLYQDFLSPEERRNLLERHASDMDALCAAYGANFFPPFDYKAAERSWQPYPGLAPETRERIESEYRCTRNRPGFFLERFTRRSARYLRGRLPVVNVIFDVARRSGLKRALLSGMEKMQ